MMRAIATVAMLTLITVGCDRSGGATSPLKPIDARYGIYFARLEIRTTVTPSGVIRSVRTEDKSYGPGDIDPSNERIEVRQGQLTQAQIAQLVTALDGWENLSDKRYPSQADAADIIVHYGNKQVAGTVDSPKQLSDVDAVLRSFAAVMPVVKPTAP